MKTTAASAEDLATTILKGLVSATGESILKDVLGVLLGGVGELASPVEHLIAAVLRGVLDVIEPGQLQNIIDEEYAAARAAADAEAERVL